MIQDFIRFVTVDQIHSTFTPPEFYNAHRYLMVKHAPKTADKFLFKMPGQEGYPMEVVLEEKDKIPASQKPQTGASAGFGAGVGAGAGVGYGAGVGAGIPQQPIIQNPGMPGQPYVPPPN